MLGQSSQHHFNQVWKRKMESQDGLVYVPGINLRVDKALQNLSRGFGLLDIGCGNGILLSQIQDRFEDARGIDVAEDAVNLVRQNGLRADVVNLNLESLPYPDSHFDVITILSALQYFYDLNHVLGECYRVLSHSGILMLSVPNMRTFWRIGRLLFRGTFPRVSKDKEGYDGGTLHYFAFANLNQLLVENGFKILWAHGIFCTPRFFERFPDRGWIGAIKREFFGAETFIMAVKALRD